MTRYASREDRIVSSEQDGHHSLFTIIKERSYSYFHNICIFNYIVMRKA